MSRSNYIPTAAQAQTRHYSCQRQGLEYNLSVSQIEGLGRRMTSDFFRYAPEGQKAELIDRVMIMHSPPLVIHERPLKDCKDLPGFRESFRKPDPTRLTVYFCSKMSHKTWQVWFSSLP